jgi:DNA mismatch endonuclease, patch repair protein
MADIVDRSTRSRMMGGIRGKNTEPERLVRKHLYRHRIGYTLHRPDLPGKPDIVLSKYQAVIFVHGCFWHQHQGCRYCSFPKTNQEFWRKKLSGNVVRDARHRENLERLGWRVFVVWECEAGAVEVLNALVRGITE